jgi:transposase InsO family protein
VGNTVCSSHEQARQALFEYLEIYYNRQRRHSTLGYVNPLVRDSDPVTRWRNSYNMS